MTKYRWANEEETLILLEEDDGYWRMIPVDERDGEYVALMNRKVPIMPYVPEPDDITADEDDGA